MKPSEVIKMRDRLSREAYEEFRLGFFHVKAPSRDLAVWLIETGWVTEVPSEEE